jgi:probable rRNA maturation factor
MTMKQIFLTAESKTKILTGKSLKAIKQCAEKALKLAKIANIGPVAINFVSKKKIIDLKKQFWGEPMETDVISFKYYETNCHWQEIFAEIIICPAVVKENAKKYNVSFSHELIRCIVHGCLHIAGENDLVPAERQKMKRKENSIIQKIIEKYPQFLRKG